MRLINPDKLESGMELGRTIYGPNGQVFLKKGVVLREGLISVLQKQNYSGVYIDDDFSREIEIKDIVDDELRNESVRRLKSFFVTLQSDPGPKYLYKDTAKLNKLLSDMVDQVILNKALNVNLIDLKNYDDYTFQHSVNVAMLATVLGVAMNYPRRELMNLARGALFHDIGKMFVDKNILNKPEKLTPEEFETMKAHSTLGYEYAKKYMDFSGEALIGILQHHEKYDGQGYPGARGGRAIHKNAQVIAISDVYDAMTSNRVYHNAILPSEAIEYIMGNINRHFSPETVEVFLKKVPAYPLGVCVGLSNGGEGIVCENHEGFTMRPKIKMFTDNPMHTVYTDLRDKENWDITIVGLIWR